MNWYWWWWMDCLSKKNGWLCWLVSQMGRLCSWFGNTSGEYWLGLDNIYHLPKGSKSTKLWIDTKDKDGNTAYASYSTFYIGVSITDYIYSPCIWIYWYCWRLSCIYNLMKFSTKDNDNDQWSCGNRASSFAAYAWWYNSCYISNLNGLYGVDGTRGIHWGSWRNSSLPFVEMKI